MQPHPIYCILCRELRRSKRGFNTLHNRYEMVDDDTPITGGDMNPDDHADTDNVYSSAGFHIPPEQVKLGIEIFKKNLQTGKSCIWLVIPFQRSPVVDRIKQVTIVIYDSTTALSTKFLLFRLWSCVHRAVLQHNQHRYVVVESTLRNNLHTHKI